MQLAGQTNFLWGGNFRKRLFTSLVNL